MVDWKDIITWGAGALLTGISTIIYSGVRKILALCETFAAHIVECSIRNEAHKEQHSHQDQETNRRLSAIEATCRAVLRRKGNEDE